MQPNPYIVREEMMTAQELAYLQQTQRNTGILVTVLRLAGAAILMAAGYLWFMSGDGETALTAGGFGIFFLVFGWGLSRYVGSVTKDIREMQKVYYEMSIHKKEKEDDGYELDFQDRSDIDVTKAIFDQVAVGDVCIIERAKHSNILIAAYRKSDQFQLVTRKGIQ